VPDITSVEFLRFRDFFYRKTGIYFDEGKRYFVDKRLLQRIRSTQHDDFKSYFSYLRFQASQTELQALTNLLTVNETYFFREEYQFRCMVNSVLPELTLRAGRQQPIRIWSIPCSSGEEAYSIAIYLLEHWPALAEIDVEIIASDIDSQILERAERGLYSRRALQHLPAAVIRRHFSPVAAERFQLSDELRASVAFTQVNVADPQQVQYYRHFDLIFCRNMLIYFDDTSRRRAAEALFDALEPGGFLFLGHCESMSRISALFTIRKFPDAFAYQRPLTQEGT
jgi:chemotaxis protein methyltransferase CheR